MDRQSCSAYGPGLSFMTSFLVGTNSEKDCISVKLVLQTNKNKEKYKALTNGAFPWVKPNQKFRGLGCLSVQFLRVPSHIREQAGQGKEGGSGGQIRCPSGPKTECLSAYLYMMHM